MITRLRVKNYLSLKDVDVELGRRNILVGPNMAGKSNFIDCFKFLVHVMSSGISKAFLDRGGFSEVVWKGNADSRISFQLSAETGGEATKRYEYELVIVGSTTGLISVEKEHLIVRAGTQVSSLIDLQYGQGQITYLDGSQAFRPPGPGQSALEFASGFLGVAALMTARYAIANTALLRIGPPPGRGRRLHSLRRCRGRRLSRWEGTRSAIGPPEFSPCTYSPHRTSLPSP